MKKIILVILMIIIMSGCKNNQKPIDTDNDLENANIIKIKDNISFSSPEAQFVLKGISEASSLALTTDYGGGELSTGNGQLVPNTSSDAGEEEPMPENNTDEKKININISNELLLDLTYYKLEGEEPRKIELTNLQIKKKPKIGSLRLYAIVEGDSNNYIDFMRDNEIMQDIQFTQDIFGNRLIDGYMNIMFSATIEDIVKVSFKEHHEKETEELLRDKNITEEDLAFIIYFEITITTDNGKYYLPFEYENDGENIISQKNHQFALNNPINFIKIE